jgi:hypothetical protein
MRTDPNDGIPIFADEDEAREAVEDGELSEKQRAAAEEALTAIEEGWDAEELNSEEVLHEGQADNCHVQDSGGKRRLWLSRTGVADGEPFENTVSIEVLIEGKWVTVAKYDGGELPEDDEAAWESGTFKLDIDLGNAAMSSHENVAAALRKVAKKIAADSGGTREGPILDLNGRTVGRFEIGPVRPELAK